jgi:hypothetical protein
VKPPTEYRLVRNDAAVPVLLPPDKAYEVHKGEHVVGVVAGSGKVWAAGRIMPSRDRPIASIVLEASRQAAVEKLLRGTP